MNLTLFVQKHRKFVHCLGLSLVFVIFFIYGRPNGDIGTVELALKVMGATMWFLLLLDMLIMGTTRPELTQPEKLETRAILLFVFQMFLVVLLPLVASVAAHLVFK